jgi:serine phosphatase RsbU (regulator of sigma subunit)/pSer/pThr/pTyr-binding forkhead associated (FHA) protein
MATLILLKSPGGAGAGQSYRLDQDRMVIGRDADQCQIAIPNSAVSRAHAVISRQAGQYLLTDLGSRNGTYVNQARLTAPAALRTDDRVKICDFLFRFAGDEPQADEYDPDALSGADSGDLTTVQATVKQKDAQQFIAAQPTDRLVALLDISTRLSKTLELEPLLPQVADVLFGVFRQADRCFLILMDEQANRLVPTVVKTRRPGAADDARYSRTIVKRCLDTLQAYLSEDASSDTALGPAQSIAEFRIRSVMCVPLATAEGKRLGAIQIDTQDASKKFKEDDVKLLTIVANLASVAIDKAQVHAELLLRQRQENELKLARTVQLGFLPKTFPEVPGYDFFAFYSPAQSVGGDYYDFLALPGGRVAVVVGDVAGKGVAAALLMAKLSAEVRFCFLTEPDPARAMTRLNDALIHGGIGDRFVALAAAVVDPQANAVTLVCGGLETPLRCRHGELTEAISRKDAGLPLGLVLGNEYTARTVELDPGDTVLIFSDGVSDAGGTDNPFGRPGLTKAIRCEDVCSAHSTQEVGERVVKALTDHAGGRPQFDDIAFVCVGRATDAGPKTGTAPLIRVADPGSGLVQALNP